MNSVNVCCDTHFGMPMATYCSDCTACLLISYFNIIYRGLHGPHHKKLLIHLGFLELIYKLLYTEKTRAISHGYLAMFLQFTCWLISKFVG